MIARVACSVALMFVAVGHTALETTQGSFTWLPCDAAWVTNPPGGRGVVQATVSSAGHPGRPGLPAPKAPANSLVGARQANVPAGSQ